MNQDRSPVWSEFITMINPECSRVVHACHLVSRCPFSRFQSPLSHTKKSSQNDGLYTHLRQQRRKTGAKRLLRTLSTRKTFSQSLMVGASKLCYIGLIFVDAVSRSMDPVSITCFYHNSVAACRGRQTEDEQLYTTDGNQASFSLDNITSPYQLNKTNQILSSAEYYKAILSNLDDMGHFLLFARLF